VIDTIRMWIRSKIGVHNIAGTRCRWCDAWILKNPFHAPIPLCEPCFKFAWHHKEATYTMQVDCFHAEAKMWVYLMQTKDAATVEQIIEGEKKEVTQELAADEEELISVQGQLGRAIRLGDKQKEREMLALYRAHLARPNPLRKLQAQLEELAEGRDLDADGHHD